MPEKPFQYPTSVPQYSAMEQAFNNWWAENYAGKFASMPGVMELAWKEIGLAAFKAGWYF